VADQRFYVVECTADECRAEFWLNDIPVARRGGDRGFHYGAPINEFIIDGRNELAVVIEPGPTPGSALSGPGGRRRTESNPGAKAVMMLSAYPRGAVVGGPDRVELASVSWSGEEAPILVGPRVITGFCEIASPFPRWSWQTSETVVLNRETRADLEKFVAGLHLSLEGCLVEPLVEASRIRYAEIETAHYLSSGDREAFVTGALSEMMERSYWGMQPLDTSPFDPRLCGSGRLVQLVCEDDRAVLRRNPNKRGQVIFFDMMAGKVDGEWHVLR